MNIRNARTNYNRLPQKIKIKALTIGWLRFITYFIGFFLNPVGTLSDAPFTFYIVTCAFMTAAILTSMIITRPKKIMFDVIILFLTVVSGISLIPNIWAAVMLVTAVNSHYLFRKEFLELEKQIPPKTSAKKQDKYNRKGK
jgi:hypothetical protein